MEFYRVGSIPDSEIDKRAIFDAMMGGPFAIAYDFAERSTLIGISENHEVKVQLIQSFIKGMKLLHANSISNSEFNADIISFYSNDPNHAFQDIFNLPLLEGFAIVAFIPATEKELSFSKEFIERILSSKKVRETSSEPQSSIGSRSTRSTQREVYDDSEETLALSSMLNLVNEAILGGGVSYKLFIVIAHGNQILDNYIKSRFLVLSSNRIKNFKMAELWHLNRYIALPFGPKYLSTLICFNGNMKINYMVRTLEPEAKGDLKLGYFVSNGVKTTEMSIEIDSSLLNLGFIITGLPGMGKTTEAMVIADQLLRRQSRPKMIIISPTDEWSGFARAHKMHLVRLYKDAVPLNFFRRPECISKEKFYENLAMILASAADAGPYQNPMEKCMLNAFRKVYGNTDIPDPVDVYDSIEESIIELHAKRTNAGIKYTKHGENIKSALENLRAILGRPEYAAKEGISIEELLEGGVVFDISNASTSTKQYLYALILNQVYAIASSFDTNGDNELRLAIFLEEAQTIFGNRDSTAVQDIKQRIQDFRKQGIGLIMLAHNASDIESGIRRLCQLKLYFRQAADIAPLAVKDLAFALADDDNTTLKIKMLESNIGALSYVTLDGNAKVPHDTVFIHTIGYQIIAKYDANNSIGPIAETTTGYVIPQPIETEIYLMQHEAEGKNAAAFVKVIFLGECLGTYRVPQKNDEAIKLRLLNGKHYTIQALNRQKHIIKEIKIEAKPKITLNMDLT